MPHVITLHDRNTIEGFVRKNTSIHHFELADLDDQFWPHTVWYGWSDDGMLKQLAVVYTALSPPILIAYPRPPSTEMRDFLRALIPLLPHAAFAHLGPSCVDVLEEVYRVTSHGLHWSMALVDPALPGAVPESRIIRLSAADLDRVERFYAEAGPGLLVNRRMIETGYCYGVECGARLASVGGLHAYSPTYGVAVLGNVATHPDFRRQGFGRSLCAALCRKLVHEGIEEIGLQVGADNKAAVRLYQQLGFEKTAEFGAYDLQRNVSQEAQSP